MSDYRNLTFRLIDIGLDLRTVNDKLSEGKWVRLDNTRTIQEGGVSIREGRATYVSTGNTGRVHTIKRIGDSTILVGVGDSIYANSTLLESGFSGDPITLASMQPVFASGNWHYIGDTEKARKVIDTGDSFQWGITPPDLAPSFATDPGSGSLDTSAPGATVYDWRYTFYSTLTGAESNGSPTAAGITVVGTAARIIVRASDDPQVDQIRLYRRGGTNGGSVWRFVLSGDNTDQTLIDFYADSAIALNDPLQLDNDVPFTSVDTLGNALNGIPLPYVAGPFVGKYIIATGDPNRPGYVYWTNPERPDSADVVNNVQVTSPNEPLQGVLIYGTLPYVFSKEALYFLNYGGPQAIPTFIPQNTTCGLGVVGPWAFCVGPEIYFVNRLGIYRTDAQSEPQSITEDSLRPLFRGESVSNFAPIDLEKIVRIKLTYAGEDLHFFYIDTAGGRQHLIWCRLYQRWRTATTDDGMERVAYLDENQSTTRLLLGVTDGRVLYTSPNITTDSGIPIVGNIRTGSIDFDAPQTLKEVGNFLLDADPGGGTITITPYINGELTPLPAVTVSGSGRQKFPLSLSDTYVYAIAFDFTWTGPAKLYQFDLLWRLDEESVTHWEMPPGANGMSGWQHIRDAYITLRSTDVVNFTIEVDGTGYAYAIPSTGGEKRKTYIPLRAVKGKLFKYAFDSNSSFRLYGDDCELRIKEWNTKLGYQLTRTPFTKLGSDGSRG